MRAAPTPATLARMVRAGLLLKSGPDGFTLFSCAAPDPAAPTALFPLLFILQPYDPAFRQYTDLPLDAGPARVYCLHPAPDPPAPTAGVPPRTPPGSGRYERRLGEGKASTDWGLLELGADLLAAAPAVYTISFRVRPTIWRYHLRPRGAASLAGAVIQTGTGVDFTRRPVPGEGAELCFEASAPISLAERYAFPPFRLVFAPRGGSTPPERLVLLPPATPSSVRCEGMGAEAVCVSDIFVYL